MNLSFYQKLTILFFIFFIGIGVIGFLAYRNNVALTKSNQWVEHTQKVLNESEKIFSLPKVLPTANVVLLLPATANFFNLSLPPANPFLYK